MDIWAVAVDYTKKLRRRPHSGAAWQNWFQFVYPRLYYAMYRVTRGDVQQAEDLTQGAIERFLRYRAIDKVKTDQESVAYLVRTAQRLNIDLVRERRLQSELHEAIGSTMHERMAETEDEVSSALEFEQLMNRLATPDRQLIRWLCAGRSVNEIATYLGISYATAATRLHRAKTRLKKIAEGM